MLFDSNIPTFPARPKAAGTERLRFQEGIRLEELGAGQTDPPGPPEGRKGLTFLVGQGTRVVVPQPVPQFLAGCPSDLDVHSTEPGSDGCLPHSSFGKYENIRK